MIYNRLQITYFLFKNYQNDLHSFKNFSILKLKNYQNDLFKRKKNRKVVTKKNKYWNIKRRSFISPDIENLHKVNVL